MCLQRFYRSMLPIYLMVIFCFIGVSFVINREVTTLAELTPLTDRRCIIIDAGHGGIDGGATSCTGVLESKLNLEVAARLNDLLHLLGIETKMIRTEDISIYTEGETIAAKKVSDLKARVKIVNEMPNCTLVSIHMNYFPDNQYNGPQVFCSSNTTSKDLAYAVQEKLNSVLNPLSARTVKNADRIYLMQNINNPGILIECGFISNPEEEAKLRNSEYQKKLCGIIATQLVIYYSNT